MARLSRTLLLAVVALLAFVCLTAPAVHAASGDDDSSSDASQLYSIEGSVKLPRAEGSSPNGASASLSSARVLLNGGEHVALVRADGSFRFGHVVPGKSYTLDVVVPAYDFATVRVEVSGKVGSRGRLTAVQLPGKSRLALPLILRPQQTAVYFAPREAVNVLGLLKNPMVLMMLVTVFMAFVMPKMMSNMDPEELKEMQKMQSSFSLDGLKKKIENKAAEIKADAR